MADKPYCPKCKSHRINESSRTKGGGTFKGYDKLPLEKEIGKAYICSDCHHFWQVDHPEEK
jgi:hypothetical protein